MATTVLIVLQSIFTCSLFALNEHGYDPHELFTQEFKMMAGNEFCSAKGVPGRAYWQKSSSYFINARLSEKDSTTSGHVTISYTNNSPDKLNYVWLQPDENIFNCSSSSLLNTKFC